MTQGKFQKAWVHALIFGFVSLPAWGENLEQAERATSQAYNDYYAAIRFKPNMGAKERASVAEQIVRPAESRRQGAVEEALAETLQSYGLRPGEVRDLTTIADTGQPIDEKTYANTTESGGVSAPASAARVTPGRMDVQAESTAEVAPVTIGSGTGVEGVIRYGSKGRLPASDAEKASVKTKKKN